MSTRRRGLLLIIAVVLVAGACGGDDEPEIAAPPTSSGATEGADGTGTTIDSTTGETTPEGTTLVAQARADTIEVWDSPTDNDDPEQTLDADDEASGHVVLLVKQELGPNWLEVWLPDDPAGSSGWVQREDVSLSRHRFRIEVTLSAHTLAVYAGDVQALETPVAVGANAPAPGPGLYIKDLVQTPDPTGPYGRYAYGLSGSTNRVEDFEAGEGVVGVHGTDDESTLGEDVAQGSLAIAAEPLDRLVGSIGLPLGTPVEILP
ncbi:MAG TPA: L,D-transpeptidase [Acidimicrobiales bacterium]